MHKEGLVASITVIVNLFSLRLAVICVFIDRLLSFMMVREYFELAAVFSNILDMAYHVQNVFDGEKERS
jgi:hypothetical protein